MRAMEVILKTYFVLKRTRNVKYEACQNDNKGNGESDLVAKPSCCDQRHRELFIALSYLSI